MIFLIRIVNGSEHPIPSTEDNGEALAAVAVHDRVVVPDMEAGRIENIAEGPVIQVEIGVVEVADQGGEDSHGQDDFAVDTQHEQREVGEAPVDHDLHDVEAEVPNPIQFLDGMMDLVKRPEPGHAVEHNVDQPFHKVLEHQENEELKPEWSIGQQVPGTHGPGIGITGQDE